MYYNIVMLLIQKGGFKKVAHAVINSGLFILWSKSFNVQGYDAQAKFDVFLTN